MDVISEQRTWMNKDGWNQGDSDQDQHDRPTSDTGVLH
jgi:hypothetical protein